MPKLLTNAAGEQSSRTRQRLLDPMERIAEVLFGLIMVLTLTCSFSIAAGDQRTGHELLLAALGCNLAWGLIDAILYLMTRFSEYGRGILALERLRASRDVDEARSIIAEGLPPLVASVLTPMEFAQIHRALQAIPEIPRYPNLTRNDWLAGLGVFLLVFLSTVPVAIPLLLVPDAKLAVRFSNAVALVMLFIAGYAFGRYAMRRHWWATGLAMALLGVALVAITIKLGG